MSCFLHLTSTLGMSFRARHTPVSPLGVRAVLHSSWHTEPSRLGQRGPSVIPSALRASGLRACAAVPSGRRGHARESRPCPAGRTGEAPGPPITQRPRLSVTCQGERCRQAPAPRPRTSPTPERARGQNVQLLVSCPAGDFRGPELQGAVTHSWNGGLVIHKVKPGDASASAPPQQALLRAEEQLRSSRAPLPGPLAAAGGWPKGSERRSAGAALSPSKTANSVILCLRSDSPARTGMSFQVGSLQSGLQHSGLRLLGQAPTRRPAGVPLGRPRAVRCLLPGFRRLGEWSPGDAQTAGQPCLPRPRDSVQLAPKRAPPPPRAHRLP